MDSKYVPRVLIVDDSRSTVRDFTEMLDDTAECVGAYSSDEALAQINSNIFDLILLDHDLGQGITGLDILKYVCDRNLNLPVIMISKYDDFQMVRNAWHAGATDFLGKTPARKELRAAVERSLAKGMAQRTNRALKRDLDKLFVAESTWNLTGTSPVIRAVNSEILKIAPTDLQVLITGESGTGKERIARAIHEKSNRNSGPFVALNCAGMAPHLADSELFGHVKGAFTGADSPRKGMFDEAAGGTLFLDEIGDMSVSVQMKLLRVLEQKEFQRLGSNTLVKTDVRVICATNADIESSVRDGKLRGDLFQRIKVASIHVPPLRDRIQDVPALAKELLAGIRQRLNMPALTLSKDAQRALQDYDWPGNVRELLHTLMNAAIHCVNGYIEVQDISATCGVQTRNRSYADAKNEVLERFQNSYWTSLWKYCSGNKTEMARISGVTRQGIDKILKSYGINTNHNLPDTDSR